MLSHAPIDSLPRFQVNLFAVGLGLLSLATSSLAATATWDGSIDANWASISGADSNWTAGAGTSGQLASGDSAFFTGTSAAGFTLNNDLTTASFNIANITFDATATTAYTITGNDFTLTGNISNSAAATTHTLNTNIVVATGAHSISNTNSSLILNGNLTGDGSIIQSAGNSSTARVTLGGDNSGFTGSYTQSNTSSGNRLTFAAASAGSAQAAWTFDRDIGLATTFTFGTGTINFGSLSGAGFLRNTAGGTTTTTLSVGALDTSTVFSGQIQDNTNANIALAKVGTGSLTLSGSNNFDGTTTIGTGAAGAALITSPTANGGTLNASAAGSLGGGLGTGTASITVNNGGTLALSGGGNLNRVRDAAPVNLGTAGAADGSVGGTLSMASTVDMVEGNSAIDNGDGIGALTLTSNSTLNFGNLSGQSTLVSDSFAPGTFTLSVLNWTGTLGTTGIDGTTDRLIFDVNPGATFASQISFFNDAGAFLGTGSAMALGLGLTDMFEIVPVPEPSTWAAGVLTVVALGCTQRRRFRNRGLRKANWETAGR